MNNVPQQIELVSEPGTTRRTTCYAEEFFDLCERSRNKEIWIYSVERGIDNAQWIVSWSERRTPANAGGAVLI